MKKTHMSVGVYDQSWHHSPSPTRRTREKHRTACGSVCDRTKATTERDRVTCHFCIRKIGAQR